MAYPTRSLEEVVHLLKDGQGSRSLTDFADELGVSKQYLSNVFNGNAAPSDRLLQNFGYVRDDRPRYVQIKPQEKRMSTATKIGCASKNHAEKLRRPQKGTAKKTLVNVVMDKSGSMSTKVQDIIGGFNTYIAELKKDAAMEYLLTLTLFDTDFVEAYLAEPLSKVQDLDTKTYQPGGGTALNDAIGRTIKLVEGDSRNADKIITVIMTDGEENSSHEYSTEAVKQLIERKEKDGWAFIFLGASLNAFQQGAAYGISHANTARYDQGHYTGTYAAVANATSNIASGLATMDCAFSATPDSMLRCANLQVGSDAPVTGSSGLPPFVHSTPGPVSSPNQTWPRGRKSAKGWNPRKK
jgi:uncharacterized protein YegL